MIRSGYLILFTLLCGATVFALEPVSLEPSEALEPGQLEISEEGYYQQEHHDQFTANTEMEYAFSERLGLRLAAPVEWASGEGSGDLGDLGLRLQLVLNPEATRWPVATLSAEALIPTGDESDALGGELQLRLTKSIDTAGQHALHLDFAGGKPTNSDEDVRDLYYKVVAGYTFAASESTTLYADFVREQLERYGQNSNSLEVGIRQQLNDSTALTLGVGAGLGEESPDWAVNAGLELRFHLHK